MNAMIRRFSVVPALALIAGLTACEDDGVTTRPALAGEFAATEATFFDAADANTSFDLIAQDGTLDLNLRNDGTFTSDLAVLGRDRVVTNGTFARVGSQIRFTSGGVTNDMDFTFDGSNLTLVGPSGDFDFGDGAVPSRLDASLRLQ